LSQLWRKVLAQVLRANEVFRRVDGSSGALTFVTEKSCRAGIAGKQTFTRAATEQTFDPREAVRSISVIANRTSLRSMTES
jgi:hypothetical protein